MITAIDGSPTKDNRETVKLFFLLEIRQMEGRNSKGILSKQEPSVEKLVKLRLTQIKENQIAGWMGKGCAIRGEDTLPVRGSLIAAPSTPKPNLSWGEET